MKPRALSGPIEELAFSDHKIALVSGPRQCGKTTLARAMLNRRRLGVYHNWDEVEFRRAWASGPRTLVPEARGNRVPLVVLDEIHKDRRWKRNLKGVYDTLAAPCDLLVTGSARLNVYMKGSDSLLGRHLSFRLHPFTIREMERTDVPRPDEFMAALSSRAMRTGRAAQANLRMLLKYGPFPEPLLAQDERKARLWRRNREQLVVREDLRDISRIPELGRVELLTAMLPQRIGSLFGLASVARDLEAGIPTIQRWLACLKELYYLFEVKPWRRGVPRSLRREGKIYLWDYAGVDNAAARCENLVACHLLKTCHFWTDTGEGSFELYYLRDKDKRELDFLIVRDGLPWLPIEVKSGEPNPSPNWKHFAGLLPCRLGLQLTLDPRWNVHEFGDRRVIVAGAAEALRYLA